MGLLKAIAGAAGGLMADQWKEFIYCEALPNDILATKGKKRTSARGSNNKGSDDIISNGSVIAVNEGQYMLIVEQGKIVDLRDEPGEYMYETSEESSIFYGGLMNGLAHYVQQWRRRVGFGGETGRDQRVYFINKKEIMGNRFQPLGGLSFRAVDKSIGLDIDVSLSFSGQFSYRIVDPRKFFANVSGNVKTDFRRASLDSLLTAELIRALNPALALLSGEGIRYSELPGRIPELIAAINRTLLDKWTDYRGIELASMNISGFSVHAADHARIAQLQRAALMNRPGMAAASATVAASSVASVGDGRSAVGAPSPWTCHCGTSNTSKFCFKCGRSGTTRQ